MSSVSVADFALLMPEGTAVAWPLAASAVVGLAGGLIFSWLITRRERQTIEEQGRQAREVAKRTRAGR